MPFYQVTLYFFRYFNNFTLCNFQAHGKILCNILHLTKNKSTKTHCTNVADRPLFWPHAFDIHRTLFTASTTLDLKDLYFSGGKQTIRNN